MLCTSRIFPDARVSFHLLNQVMDMDTAHAACYVYKRSRFPVAGHTRQSTSQCRQYWMKSREPVYFYHIKMYLSADDTYAKLYSINNCDLADTYVVDGYVQH
jgi:hypothetical protein